MMGTLAGTDSWFHDPAAQVSAHFGVGKDGTCYQWVDTATVAWAEASYNGEAISIEHEGISGDSLTPAQIAADVQLVQWIGLPLVMAPSPSGTGWIGHGELGAAGGNHPDCPGSPILAQWPAVLALATGTPPKGTPPDMISTVAYPNGTVDVFYIGEDGRIYQLNRSTAGAWSLFQPTALSGDASHPAFTK